MGAASFFIAELPVAKVKQLYQLGATCGHDVRSTPASGSSIALAGKCWTESPRKIWNDSLPRFFLIL
jgi:hypothetical protein